MIQQSPYPFELVCPGCRSALEFFPDEIRCRSCAAQYGYRSGVPDLILGGRFDDVEDDELYAHEEMTCTYTTEQYMIPLLRRLFPDPGKPPRVLSLGCGLGIDVDLLNRAGYRTAGIDNGNRTVAWQRRSHRACLYLANGKHLPFEHGSFDMVYCGCVFPHVGVEGDSNRVTAGYLEDRLSVAREMSRVLRPNGAILVSSPNRLFPLDLFHGRKPGKQIWPRLNPPTSPFLLSAKDYSRLFAEGGYQRRELLPVDNYWGFFRRNKSLAGRLTALPVKTVFKLSSTAWGSGLRNSFVSPWISMLFQR